MNKFVVLIFSDEVKAYEGTRVLKELHAESSIALYSTAVIAKDDAGTVVIKDAAGEGPLGTAVGALTGGLVGLLAGPIGAVLGVAGGALLGTIRDMFNTGVSAQFVQTIADELHPGKTAVIAEIHEEWVTPLDTRIEALGGIVIRTWRSDVEDEQIEQDVIRHKTQLEQLKGEYAQAGGAVKNRLDAHLAAVKTDLQAASQRSIEKVELLQEETEAKIETLQEQAQASAADVRARVELRIEQLREDHAKRVAKLRKAWAYAKDAFD